MKTKLKAYIEEQRKRVIETYKLSDCEQSKNYLAGQMYALSQIDKLFCKEENNEKQTNKSRNKETDRSSQKRMQ